MTAAHLSGTSWLCGPAFLKQIQQTHHEECSFKLVNPSLDVEIRPQVSTMKTTTLSKQLGSHLTHIACLFQKTPATQVSSCKGCITATQPFQSRISQELRDLSSMQFKTHAQEYTCVRQGGNLPKDSPLKALDPFIDADSLLRVGGLSEKQNSSQRR